MSVNWGSVPDWVAAGGTSAATLLALVILARDKRSVEQAQVSRLIVESSHRVRPDAASWLVEIRNASEYPFYTVHLWVATVKRGRGFYIPLGTFRKAADADRFPDRRVASLLFRDQQGEKTVRLEPGASARAVIDLPSDSKGGVAIGTGLQDAQGRRWAIEALEWRRRTVRIRA